MKIFGLIIVAMVAVIVLFLVTGLTAAAKMMAGIAIAAAAVLIALVGGFWISLPMLYLDFHWMWPTQFPLS